MKQIECINVVHEQGSDVLQSASMQQTKRFMQHGTTSVYVHSISVAAACVSLARFLRLKVNERALVRGALLHDYFLYDWHDSTTAKPGHATRHGYYALENAQRDFQLNATEADMISKHMFPLSLAVPAYTESWVLCAADKWVSLRETAQGAFARFAR